MNPAKLIKALPFVVVIAALGYLFKPMLLGKVPMPWDGLVGTYFPWLDYKWGFAVGVPVKNVALTDAFSLYQWRTLAIDAFRHFQWPLWNQYSFSGFPLLANWQSAPFYPLNVLMLVFGDLAGWSVMVLLQPVLALALMYLYLKQIGIKTVSALLGGIVFSLAGFMSTYLEYNLGGQILLWLPGLLYLTEKFLTTKRPLYLVLITPLVYAVATGGFFQPALYVYLVFGAYFLFRSWQQKKDRVSLLMSVGFFAALGLGLALIQMLPVLELFKLSIRNVDGNIFQYHFGLLPLAHGLTLLAPDFFGNPVTYNFWGFMQYQETAGYFGVVGIVLVICGILSKEHRSQRNFFTAVFLLTLLLAFKNPLSSLVFTAKMPLLSTGYASRWLMLTGFAAGVLSALGLDSDNRKRFLIWGAIISLALVILVLYTGGLRYFFAHSDAALSFDAPTMADHLKVAFRNSLLPGLVIVVFTIACLIFRKSKLLPLFILMLITFDLTRFSVKFNPFAPTAMAKNDLEVTQFVRENIGQYRVEKESGPLLPLNSWMNFRLMSPSGYDPLLPLQYGSFFRVYNSDGTATKFEPEKLGEGSFTRYLEWTNYQSPFVDLAGVKYILALKRDKDVISASGNKFFYSFPTNRFKKVYEYGATAVFENPGVVDRVSLFDQYTVEPDYLGALERLRNGFDFRHKIILNREPHQTEIVVSPSDTAKIVTYTANKVEIETQTKSGAILMLTDSYYPGWRASVNGVETRIYLADGVYRAVEVPSGTNRVVFEYAPRSFYMGVKIALASLILWGLASLYLTTGVRIRKL